MTPTVNAFQDAPLNLRDFVYLPQLSFSFYREQISQKTVGLDSVIPAQAAHGESNALVIGRS